MPRPVPTPAKAIKKLLNPIRALSESGRLGGLLLIGATALSLVLANSAVGPTYVAFWEKHVTIGVLQKSVSHWINDGLMAVFFFLVGMEIKREVQEGELAVPRQALLPALAAVGGAAVPALLHLLVTAGTPAAHGWAIPTATDIAFSLGLLALLGPRIPFALRVFLTALAIIDDLLAVLVIAFFYTAELHWEFLLAAAGVVGLLLLLKHWRRRAWLGLYLGLGVVLWFCFLESGVHATLAGVLLALIMPTPRLRPLELALDAPVSYGILPLFALCNTAIPLAAGSLPELGTPLGLGVMLGLIVGKPVGIVSTVWVLVRTGLADLPRGVNWKQMVGLGCVAGIGFTMAIFIATLSFPDAATVDLAKLAVLSGSGLAAVLGTVILLLFGRTRKVI